MDRLKLTMKKWIADLESGKFTQGEKALRNWSNDNGEKLCCLGVMVLHATVWSRPKVNLPCFDMTTSFGEVGTLEIDTLSDEIADFFDKLPDSQYDLIALNDGGMSFKDIASVIRYVHYFRK